MEKEILEFGHFYHIYNRGNNKEAIFFDDDNYRYFLKLLLKYIDPVADVYAYCLLKNHFHLLIRIKSEQEINVSDFKFSTIEKSKSINPSKQFSHFFNAYTQAINKRYNRTGSLLEKPFERKRITDENYLKQIILYIHNNPVKHGITSNANQYFWSSYHSILSDKPSKLKRKEVLDYFENETNFIFSHNNYDSLNLPY
ncbi:REP element-mobilizing transposase RayT [Epilithonimonas bovis DSM 19482]|jgi:REP element-mobilizing transposase RayT|uniref:REP element-mobilizing transposase RayT n=1 Tax=Epilithonimonas bovis DSM 19482 TaxID=1121284 RepID=A0A1U7PWQ2_9FLAO|nr:transposase [Epilithonimonas bovis]SIT96392.1 REP element-mobilizing transposase RayT [Epilithonimonas bovis DSM 19482]